MQSPSHFVLFAALGIGLMLVHESLDIELPCRNKSPMVPKNGRARQPLATMLAQPGIAHNLPEHKADLVTTELTHAIDRSVVGQRGLPVENRLLDFRCLRRALAADATTNSSVVSLTILLLSLRHSDAWRVAGNGSANVQPGFPPCW